VPSVVERELIASLQCGFIALLFGGWQLLQNLYVIAGLLTDRDSEFMPSWPVFFFVRLV